MLVTTYAKHFFKYTQVKTLRSVLQRFCFSQTSITTQPDVKIIFESGSLRYILRGFLVMWTKMFKSSVGYSMIQTIDTA